MKKFLLTLILLFPFFLISSKASAVEYFGDAWFPGSYSTSTGRTSSSLSVIQNLGSADTFPITTFSALQVMLGARSGTAVFQVDLRCHNTEADMLGATGFCSSNGVVTVGVGTTTSIGPNLISINATTSYPFQSGKYYSLAIQENSNTAGAGTDWYSYGAPTTTDPWPYRCFYLSAGFKPCYSPIGEFTSSPVAVSDLYFTIYGSPLTTRLVTPTPSWNEVIPVTSTSTASTTEWGGQFYVADDDSEKTLFANVDLWKVGSTFISSTQISDISGNGFHNVFDDFSFTSPGLYRMDFWVKESGCLGFCSVDTLYATSTYFIVGYVPQGATTTLGVLEDTLSTAIRSVECNITWTNWTVTSLVSCAWRYAYAAGSSAINVLYNQYTDFIDNLFAKVPWGYFYRAYYIFTNPDPTYELPSFDVHFRFANVDRNVNFTPWSYLQDSVDTLYSTSTDNVIWLDDQASTSDSIGHSAENIANMIFGLLFVTYLVFRIAKFYI